VPLEFGCVTVGFIQEQGRKSHILPLLGHGIGEIILLVWEADQGETVSLKSGHLSNTL